jgi:uncharacterized phiE125 gp8 family phage protein
MALKQITPPTQGCITLVEAKAHLRVDFEDDDLLIKSYINAATEMCEQVTGRAIMPQTWLLTAPSFWIDKFGVLTRIPVATVESIKYLDMAGADIVLPSTCYALDNFDDSGFAYLNPAFGEVWPSARVVDNSVRVTYTAGYPNAASVPESIKNWIKLVVGSMYENREHQTVERGTVLSLGFADRMLDRYRVWSI